jgi:transcription elongation factor GreB
MGAGAARPPANHECTRGRDVSKAFTRESDSGSEGDVHAGRKLPIPAGAKNYMTPSGAQQLRERLERLGEMRAEAGQIAGAVERRYRLEEIDRQIRLLTVRLELAEVVDLTAQSGDRVRFGATVTVSENGGEHRYRIVGVDEAEPAEGRVSWLSPIAKALLNARVGTVVTVRSPRGDRELEVLRIAYEAG